MKHESVVQHIGRQYLMMSSNPDLSGKYRIIAAINKKLFSKIPYKVVFTKDDPYTNAEQMQKQVKDSGILYIFSGGSNGEFTTHRENLIGRAVHDSFAHLICNCPFTVQGEYNAYLEQRKHYPKSVWNLLFTEIVGQACTYEYIGSFDFRQKAIEAPEYWLNLFEPYQTNYIK